MIIYLIKQKKINKKMKSNILKKIQVINFNIYFIILIIKNKKKIKLEKIRIRVKVLMQEMFIYRQIFNKKIIFLIKDKRKILPKTYFLIFERQNS